MRKGQLKASSEMYRTIKGERYIQWASDYVHSRAAFYRRAGIRCAVKGNELFIHPDDADMAEAMDGEVRTRA